jgi:hypothetical protein
VSVQFSPRDFLPEAVFPDVCQHKPTGGNSILEREAVEETVVAAQLMHFSSSSSSSSPAENSGVGGPVLPYEAVTEAVSLFTAGSAGLEPSEDSAGVLVASDLKGEPGNGPTPITPLGVKAAPVCALGRSSGIFKFII